MVPLYVCVCVWVCLYCTSALSSSRCFWPLSSALICVRHLRLWSSSLRQFDSLSSPWITPYCCFFWLSSSATDSWLGTHLAVFSVENLHLNYNLTAIEGLLTAEWDSKVVCNMRKMDRGWILKLFCAKCRPFPKGIIKVLSNYVTQDKKVMQWEILFCLLPLKMY